MRSFAGAQAADELRRDATGAFPYQPFSLQGVQTPIVRIAATTRGGSHGNDLGHGAIPIEDYDSTAGTDMIEIATQPVPKFGYSGHSHVAIMAFSDLWSSAWITRWGSATHPGERGAHFPPATATNRTSCARSWQGDRSSNVVEAIVARRHEPDVPML